MVTTTFAMTMAQAQNMTALANHFFNNLGRQVGLDYHMTTQVLNIEDPTLTLAQATAILATFVYAPTPKPLDASIGDFANARLAMGTAVASFQALPANPTTVQLKTVLGQLGIATRDGFIAMGSALQKLRDPGT